MRCISPQVLSLLALLVQITNTDALYASPRQPLSYTALSLLALLLQKYKYERAVRHRSPRQPLSYTALSLFAFLVQKVQIHRREVLNLLALLVQKYKY